MQWRKSTRSNSQGNCVEVATPREVKVRDSKDRNGPVLSFSPTAWASFLNGIKSGD